MLAAEDPGPGHGDWLDTEGRPFGIVVVRFLQPDRDPTLPSTWVVSLDDLLPVGDDRLAALAPHGGGAGRATTAADADRRPGRSGTDSAPRPRRGRA